MSELLNELVFGPHNTTTILVLTLTLVYFGVLVPRPTHKRSQDLIDSKTKTIELLLNGYKEDLAALREEIVNTAKNRESLEEAIKDLTDQTRELKKKVGTDGHSTDATNEHGNTRGGM